MEAITRTSGHLAGSKTLARRIRAYQLYIIECMDMFDVVERLKDERHADEKYNIDKLRVDIDQHLLRLSSVQAKHKNTEMEVQAAILRCRDWLYSMSPAAKDGNPTAIGMCADIQGKMLKYMGLVNDKGIVMSAVQPQQTTIKIEYVNDWRKPPNVQVVSGEKVAPSLAAPSDEEEEDE